jgi:hypothetical protein
MNPAGPNIAALHQLVAGAEDAAAELVLLAEQEGTPPFGTLEDHRTLILGDLFEAFDRIEAGLGTRLLKAMYPFTADDPDFAFAEVAAPRVDTWGFKEDAPLLGALAPTGLPSPQALPSKQASPAGFRCPGSSTTGGCAR